MKALVNGIIYTGRRILDDHAILIDGEHIVDVPPRGDVSGSCEQVDLHGLSVAPGFVDLQLYGGGGIMFNEPPTVQGLREIASAHARFGVTRFLPTLVSSSETKMRTARAVVQDAIRDGVTGVMGIHFEGPFLSIAKAGAHDRAAIRPMTDEDADIILPLDGLPTLMTFAPESLSAEQAATFRDAGVKLSIGHTAATARTVNAYFDSGVHCLTHIHNAMSAFTSREPGVVGVAMADERVWAGIIVDGHHVDFQSVRATWNAWRSKQAGRLFLITDAMPPVGSSVDQFWLGDQRIRVVAGTCRTPDGVLAGSRLDMATAIRNCVRQVGIPLDEALRMASTYPAQFMGWDNRFGAIEAGMIADLAIFDDDLVVRGFARSGQIEFF